MPVFEYEALDATGKSKKGVVNAETPRQARQELRRRQLTPVALKEPRRGLNLSLGDAKQPSAPRLNGAQRVLVTRQLAVLVSASIPLEEALQAIALQSEKPAVRSVLSAIRERVLEGRRLSDAMREHPKSFPELYRGVVAAGEASGELGDVLTRLAVMLEKNRAILNAALAALIYPAAIAIVATGVMVALLTMVVPKIIENFDTMGAELPWITQMVVAISNFLGNFGLYLVLGLVVGVLAFWQALRRPAIKREVDRLMLGLPIVGRLIKGLDGARFSRTLATLFQGGSPLLDSLLAAQRTVTNSYIHERLDRAATQIREGSGLATALRRADVLPAMMVHMVAAGERAGEVPQLLGRAAAQLEEEFETATQVALKLLEPLIIMLMGAGVLVIVLSILLPILRLNAMASA